MTQQKEDNAWGRAFAGVKSIEFNVHMKEVV